MLGALLGTLMVALKVPTTTARRWLLGVAGVGGLAIILVTALPEPEYRATVLDLEVRECEPALVWQGRAVAIWEKRLDVNQNLWGAPPPDWRQTFAREAASGAVATIEVRRHRDVVASRYFWNFGAIDATPWSTTTRSRRMARPNHIYLPGGCPSAPPQTTGTFLARAAPVEERFPPLDPARFLDLLVLAPVPPEYTPFAQ